MPFINMYITLLTAVAMLPTALQAALHPMKTEAKTAIQTTLENYVRMHDADIGIAVITDYGDTVCVNNGRRYSIAVFVKSSRYGMEETERLIAEISEIVWRKVLL